jgi:hypothetical protein
MGLAVTVAAGTLHGVQTDRWNSSPQLTRALAGLGQAPRAYGDWRGEDAAYDADQMTRAGIQGCVFRVYRNTRTRESVSLLLVCGRGGPISVHTPDVCYAGVGFRQLTDAQPRPVEWGDGRRAVFQVARFGKSGRAAQLEIYWAWSRDGRTWEAPDNPRTSFARLPALYKLYAVREFVPGTREEQAESCRAFLLRSLPDLGEALAPSQPE